MTASFSSDANKIVITISGIIHIYDFKDKIVHTNSKTQLKNYNSSYASKFKFSDKYVVSIGMDKSIVYLDIRNLKTPYGVLHITDDQNDVDKFTINSNGDKVIVYKTDGKLNKIDILPFINLEKNIYDLTETIGKFKILLLINEILKFHQGFTIGKRPFIIKHPDIRSLFLSKNFPEVLRRLMIDKKYVELQ